MSTNQFQNVPSQRMYDFLVGKVQSGEFSKADIVEKFGVYQSNPASYFHALRTGAISAKLEHILAAQDHFGLNPCDLFRPLTTITAGELSFEVLEPDAAYLPKPNFMKYIGGVMREILKEFNLSAADFAAAVSQSPQNIHKMCRGEGTISADIIITLAEVTGCDMNRFRRYKTLSTEQGKQMKQMMEIITELRQEVNELRKDRGNTGARRSA